MLFVTELLQSLGNGHEREPRRNRSRWSKIDLPSHTASAWQAIGDPGRRRMPIAALGASKPSSQQPRHSCIISRL